MSLIVFLSSQTTAIVRAKILYERLVTQFPTSSRYWRLYIEQEVNLAWHRFTLPYLHGYHPLGSLGVVACYTVVLQVEVEVDFSASSLQANLHAVLVMAMKVISLSSMSMRVVTILTINLTCKTCMWVIEVTGSCYIQQNETGLSRQMCPASFLVPWNGPGSPPFAHV